MELIAVAAASQLVPSPLVAAAARGSAFASAFVSSFFWSVVFALVRPTFADLIFVFPASAAALASPAEASVLTNYVRAAAGAAGAAVLHEPSAGETGMAGADAGAGADRAAAAGAAGTGRGAARGAGVGMAGAGMAGAGMAGVAGSDIAGGGAGVTSTGEEDRQQQPHKQECEAEFAAQCDSAAVAVLVNLLRCS